MLFDIFIKQHAHLWHSTLHVHRDVSKCRNGATKLRPDMQHALDV